MVGGCMPLALSSRNIGKASNWDTPPVLKGTGWAESTATGACKLVEECLWPSVLSADDVRAHLPVMPVVHGSNLLLLDDSLNGTDNGTNGEGKSWKWDKKGGTNDYVTAKILTANATNLAGNLYIQYVPTA